MMICKADFEELFPHLFAPAAQPVAQTPVAPDSACISGQKAEESSDTSRPAPAELRAGS